MNATIYISTNNKPITIVTESGNISASEVKFASTEMILKKSDEGGDCHYTSCPQCNPISPWYNAKKDPNKISK